MSDTKTPLPPLVSDDAIAKVMADQFNTQRDHVVACGAARSVRNIYEADRAKTREVVQALVDALWQFEGAVVYVGWDPAEREKHKAAAQSLALAKSQLNIEPTKP